MKTNTFIQLTLSISDAVVLVSSEELVEPGSSIARLTANITIQNESDEIQGVSCNSINLQLFDADGQEVYLLTDDRDRDAPDAMPLQPRKSTAFSIECGLSATWPEVGKIYNLIATLGEASAEAEFSFADATARPR